MYSPPPLKQISTFIHTAMGIFGGFSNRLLLLLVLVVLVPTIFFNVAFMSRFDRKVVSTQVENEVLHPKHVEDAPLQNAPKHQQHATDRIKPTDALHPRNYTMLTKQHECPDMQRIGDSEGGWMTCIMPYINKDSVVYSFGLGNDPAFDLTFIRRYGAVVHAFDPTPTGENLYNEWENKPKEWIFHDWGLYKADENMTFLAPRGHDQYSIKNWDGKYNDGVKVERQGYRLSTIMKLLGHRHIDVCKIDIEGSEWGIIDDLLENKPDIDQIFLEFHFFDLDETDYFSVQVTEYIKKLNSLGYKWFFKNNFRQLGKRYNPPGKYNYVEYSFIRPRINP